MAILDILHFPDSRLRKTARPIEQITQQTQDLVDNMFETMYAAPGIGLASIQVGVEEQLVVIDISENHSQPLVLINPLIVKSEGLSEYEEGCLSVPGFSENVERAEWIRVDALDRHGDSFSLETDGLLSVCVQHELDHLHGKLFVDYLSKLKRSRIQKKLEKLEKESRS